MSPSDRIRKAAPALLSALERLVACVQRQRLPDRTPPAPASPLGEALRAIKQAKGDNE